MVDERTAYWGARDDARYRTRDDDPTGGDYVVAETLDANGDPVDVLLRWDDTAGEWVSGGPVNMSGEDVTNVGALDADSLSTDEISVTDSYQVIPPDQSAAVNDALASAETVILTNSTYNLQESITPTADGGQLVIPAGATVTLADDASPTVLTDTQGTNHTILIYNDGYRFDINSQGILDGNTSTFTLPTGVFYDSGSSGTISLTGDTQNIHEGAFFVDVDRVHVPFFHSTDHDAAAIAIEGASTEESTIGVVHSIGGSEAVDFNAYASNWSIGQIIGENTTEWVTEVDLSGNINIQNVECRNATRGVVFKDSTKRFTAQDAVEGDYGDITISGLTGVVDEEIFHTRGVEGTKMANNSSITGMNITTSGTDAIGINMGIATGDTVENIKLEGRIKATGTRRPVNIGNPGGVIDNVTVDLDVIGNTDQANVFKVQEVNELTGRVRAVGGSLATVSVDCGAQSVSGYDIDIHASDGSGDGVRLYSSDGSGSLTGTMLKGLTKDITGDDIVIDSTVSDTKLHIDYDTILDNGTNTQAVSYGSP